MPDGPRIFPPNEPLYRILEPEYWDSINYLIYPTAFLDEGKGYSRLSVYLGSRASPREVLRIFSAFGGIKKRFKDPKPEDLWNHGYGIGRFTVNDLIALGLDFERKLGGGIQYKSNGHVNIMEGQKAAAELALRSTALGYHEIFT